MACFSACLAEGLAVHFLKKSLKSKGKAQSLEKSLGSLETMLFGGSALLALEHIWHGEIGPYFPFLTKAATPEGMDEMINEILTVGVGMDVMVTLVWGLCVLMRRFLIKEGVRACA